VSARDRYLAHFGVHRPPGEIPTEFVFPLGVAPFIMRAEHRQELVHEAHLGQFGLFPQWAKELAFGRHTYNARSETAATKPSFRNARRRGQLCVVPAESIFEPCYESGKAVRWRISRRDGRPMGIAGLWERHTDPETGESFLSFTMLTVDADDHALFKRFHALEDEKRMPVIPHEAHYDARLKCPVERMMHFVRQFPAERLDAEPAPLLGRMRA
jgi:putative SOS response-associated peptidase YedK